MKKVMYEFETLRRNVTPRQFYRWVATEFKKRTGENPAIWLDGYDTWSDPVQPSSRHTTDEICQTLPYDWQMYVRGDYNFIMEFHFDTDTRGWGYCYIVEFER